MANSTEIGTAHEEKVFSLFKARSDSYEVKRGTATFVSGANHAEAPTPRPEKINADLVGFFRQSSSEIPFLIECKQLGRPVIRGQLAQFVRDIEALKCPIGIFVAGSSGIANGEGR